MPTPHAVIVAVLATPTPDDLDIAERATFIETALRQYGHLPPVEDPAAPAGPTLDDVETAARRLAQMSRYLRYTHEENAWRRIMESEADITVAYSKASAEQPDSAQKELQDLRHVLITWLDQQ